MTDVKVIKIGGKVVEHEVKLNNFLEQFAAVPGYKVLVHGGGAWVNDMCQKLNIDVVQIDGRRITDGETLKVVVMMLAGLANKTIVAKLQGFHCNAIGMTGADSNVIRAEKRPVKGGIDYGFVGDITRVDAEALANLFLSGFTPVLTALTHDGKGTMLNTNADTIASAVASALALKYKVELVYCFELTGVLKNIDDPGSVIHHINRDSYRLLRDEAVISKGMIPKIDNAFDAIDGGVESVRICHSEDIVKFADQRDDFGTVITS